MKNRIFRGMVISSVLVWVLCTAVIAGYFYSVYSGQSFENMEKDAGIIGQGVENFGEDPIEVAKINNVYDCLISGGYLTLTYNIYATLQGETHKISLVRNTHDTDTEEPEYTMLELRHKAEASIEDAGKRSGVVSFKLGEYDPAVTNKKGILLRVKHLDESETEEYIKINYEK